MRVSVSQSGKGGVYRLVPALFAPSLSIGRKHTAIGFKEAFALVNWRRRKVLVWLTGKRGIGG
jgi:hypothetical protein